MPNLLQVQLSSRPSGGEKAFRSCELTLGKCSFVRRTLKTRAQIVQAFDRSGSVHANAAGSPASPRQLVTMIGAESHRRRSLVRDPQLLRRITLKKGLGQACSRSRSGTR